MRHTQTDWNKEGRYQSHSDRPLTDFGRARAAAVSSRLRSGTYTASISTGLARTDEIVASLSGKARAWEKDERWREADHGFWEGLTHAEVAARYGEEARERFADFWHSRTHGGESGADLWARVEAAWESMLLRHDGGRVLVVTHGTPIRLLLCFLLGVPFDGYWQFRIDLGGITSLDLYPSGTIIRAVNEVPSLERSP